MYRQYISQNSNLYIDGRLKIVPVLTREPIATLVAQWVSICIVVVVQIVFFKIIFAL
jgi:hypothetical protein